MPYAGLLRALGADRRLGALARLALFIALYQLLRSLIGGGLAAVLPRFEGAPALLLWGGVMLLAALVAGILLLRLLDRRKAGALGFAYSPQLARELFAGLSAGVLPMLLIAVLLAAFGMLRYETQAGDAGSWLLSVLAALLTLTIAAAAEEVLYRGYAFQALVRGFGAWPTLIVTSALFALAHAGNPAVTMAALGNIFLAGLVLGLAYLKTLSLWVATALHIGWNWSMASLLDLPVSGLALIDTPLYEPTLAGPAWVSGRAFGPEGGVVGTLGLGAALVVLYAWPRLAPSAQQLAKQPLPLANPEDPELG